MRTDLCCCYVAAICAACGPAGDDGWYWRGAWTPEDRAQVITVAADVSSEYPGCRLYPAADADRPDVWWGDRYVTLSSVSLGNGDTVAGYAQWRAETGWYTVAIRDMRRHAKWPQIRETLTWSEWLARITDHEFRHACGDRQGEQPREISPDP